MVTLRTSQHSWGWDLWHVKSQKGGRGGRRWKGRDGRGWRGSRRRWGALARNGWLHALRGDEGLSTRGVPEWHAPHAVLRQELLQVRKLPLEQAAVTWQCAFPQQWSQESCLGRGAQRVDGPGADSTKWILVRVQRFVLIYNKKTYSWVVKLGCLAAIFSISHVV